jgi:hypothetical protein
MLGVDGLDGTKQYQEVIKRKAKYCLHRMLSRTGAEENMTSGQVHGSLGTVERTF